MKKKALSAFLALLFVFLAACSGGSSKVQNGTNDVRHYGEAKTGDPLRICMDIQEFTGDVISDDAVAEFLYELENSTGISDVEVEFLPPEGAEREIELDRLRTEIMAGGGPDVFILTSCKKPSIDPVKGFDFDDSNTLIMYPQKLMENGAFLPLDDFIENNTRFAQWDKFTSVVMSAGRNEEGQQIIPITYTLPVICYPVESFTYDPSTSLTWYDMLNDPEFSKYALDLANCATTYSGTVSRADYFSYTLGQIADYEEEKLLFTEDELLARVNEILSLDKSDSVSAECGAVERYIGTGLYDQYFNKPVTMLPMYSDDGGVTASIKSYAAINRNTSRAEDAFAVIDLLMSTRTQQDYLLYTNYFYFSDGIPMNEELFNADTPLQLGHLQMTEENYNELCRVRAQITNAVFKSQCDYILDSMLIDCDYADTLGKSIEETVHDAYENMQRRLRE